MPQEASETTPGVMESPLALTLGTRSSTFLQSADDFHRQRKRLNKKLAKLRKDLKIQTKDTKNYKTKEKIGKINKEDYENDSRFGLIYLLTSERDILYALETKAILEVESSKAKESFIISKYKKAFANSKKIIELTSDEKNQITKLELAVYGALTVGTLSLYQKHWIQAINGFSIARCVLQFLNKQEEFTNKSLIAELIDTLIDPSLKLAAYREFSLKSPDVSSFARKHCQDDYFPYLSNSVQFVESIDPSFVTNSEDSEAIIQEISWRNYSAKLDNEDVARLIMKVQGLENDIISNAPSSFDPVLIGWQDALDAHTLDLEKNKLDEEEDQDRAITLTFIKYNLLLNTIRRDVTLVNELTLKKSKDDVSKTLVLETNRDIIRLLETITSTTQQIIDLPGVYNDEELYGSLESLEGYYNVYKISIIGNSYYLNKSFKESLVLYSRAKDLISNIQPYKVEFPDNFANNDAISKLSTEITALFSNIHVLTQFEYESNQKSNKSGLFIIDSVNKYPVGNTDEVLNKIATTEPVLRPVHFKPTLFDVAFNYIDYDVERPKAPVAEVAGATSAVDETSDEQATQKRGFFGLFGGR